MKKINLIAKKLNLKKENLETYGDYKAKIKNYSQNPKGKLILVTAITPTKSGEGKTTVSIGLADGLNLLNKNVCLALREPSLGPVFGMKGGAVGGGKSLVVPSDDINLHFTGDMHAITAANNLLCALIDNHIFQGNDLDFQTVVFNRCMDMNDRSLRIITINQEKLKNNKERKESFVITPASEIMAILCLHTSEEDLRDRLDNIIVGYNSKKQPIYAKQLCSTDALLILLKEAIKPNLVQTTIGTPAIIHGGPFANIAHGCNSIVATKTALSLADYVVTEAGFGSDLGAEKFFDLKCRVGKLDPSVVVVVATVRAIKQNGVQNGLENLKRHIQNITKLFNKKCVVAINHFEGDSEEDIEMIKRSCKCPCVVCYPFTEGGKGCVALAQAVLDNIDNTNKLKFAYNLKDGIKQKIFDIASKVYGAVDVEYESGVEEKIAQYEDIAKGYPVVIAKTQYSFSDDDNLVGAPKFTLKIRDVEVKNGARFVVAIAGKINLMPGLPKVPNSVNMKYKN